MGSSNIGARKEEAWLALGIVLCTILASEVEGFEWCALIDGNREAPVPVSVTDDAMVDPMKLVWGEMRAGETCYLAETYENLLS